MSPVSSAAKLITAHRAWLGTARRSSARTTTAGGGNRSRSGPGPAAVSSLRRDFLLLLTDTTGACIGKRNDHASRPADHGSRQDLEDSRCED
jgi:hypothetical protein